MADEKTGNLPPTPALRNWSSGEGRFACNLGVPPLWGSGEARQVAVRLKPETWDNYSSNARNLGISSAPQPKPRVLAGASGVLKRPRSPISGLRQREIRGTVSLSYRPGGSEANPIKLAPMESGLPATLMESPGQVVSCACLIKTVC